MGAFDMLTPEQKLNGRSLSVTRRPLDAICWRRLCVTQVIPNLAMLFPRESPCVLHIRFQGRG